MDILIHRVMGRTLVTVSKTEVEKAGGTVPVTVKVIKTGFNPDKVIEWWPQFITEIMNNDDRNRLVVSTAEQISYENQRNHKNSDILVLVDRVAHAQKLIEFSCIPSVLIHGMLSDRDLKSAMAKIPNVRITIGTIGMLGEGLDIARWGSLILATPISTKVRLLQVIGRIVRPSIGKTEGSVIDFIDEHSFSRGSFSKREKIYLDHNIKIVKD